MTKVYKRNIYTQNSKEKAIKTYTKCKSSYYTIRNDLILSGNRLSKFSTENMLLLLKNYYSEGEKRKTPLRLLFLFNSKIKKILNFRSIN